MTSTCGKPLLLWAVSVLGDCTDTDCRHALLSCWRIVLWPRRQVCGKTLCTAVNSWLTYSQRLISAASDELTYAERRHRSGIDVITVSQQVLCCKE